MLKKLLICFISIWVACSPIIGETTPTSGGVVKGEKVTMNKKTNRPTDVQDDNLTCEYVGGKLYFEFEVAEGGAVVDVRKLDSGDSITATDNFGSTFIVTMGQTPGFYEIEVNTADGNTYTGYLYIDE